MNPMSATQAHLSNSPFLIPTSRRNARYGGNGSTTYNEKAYIGMTVGFRMYTARTKRIEFMCIGNVRKYEGGSCCRGSLDSDDIDQVLGTGSTTFYKTNINMLDNWALFTFIQIFPLMMGISVLQPDQHDSTKEIFQCSMI